MHWFRLYTDVLHDPKVQRLPGDLFKAWVNLLCLASQSDGRLPKIEDIAFSLRINERDAQNSVTELVSRGLLDDREGVVTPHNWAIHQKNSDSSTERMRRLRAIKRGDAACDDTVCVTCDAHGDAHRIVTCDARGDVTVTAQSRVEENRTEQNRIEQRRGEGQRFTPPTLEDAQQHFREKQCFEPDMEAEKFHTHYGAIGWVVGRHKAKMQNWRLAASGWIVRAKQYAIEDGRLPGKKASEPKFGNLL